MVDKTHEGICDLKGKYSGNCQNISNPDREITTGIKYRRRIYTYRPKHNSLTGDKTQFEITKSEIVVHIESSDIHNILTIILTIKNIITFYKQSSNPTSR